MKKVRKSLKTSVKDTTFEEHYFEGWFKNAVGTFSRQDLEISRNWFWGWLKKLNQYVDIENGHGRSVLEIGCSIGGVASLLADRGFDVHASDVSAYAVKGAKTLSPQITFSTIDIQKPIPLKKKFDLVLSFEVVEHLRYPEKGIRHMTDVLKKGGTLILSTPYPNPWILVNDPTHINVKYPEEWVTIMKAAGCTDVEYHCFSLLPYFYKFSKHFHIIFPFAIASPYINSPIFFIGKKA